MMCIMLHIQNDRVTSQVAQARNMSASYATVENIRICMREKRFILEAKNMNEFLNNLTSLVYFLPAMWFLGRFSAIPVSFSSIF